METQCQSLIDFLAFFKDEETCIKHFEASRFAMVNTALTAGIPAFTA